MAVELNKDLLVDLGGWTVLREARGLHEGDCVKSLDWEDKTLKGLVQVGDQKYYPRLNLRSTTFAENRCNCAVGKREQVCAHAIALCLCEMDGGLAEPEPNPEVISEAAAAPEPETALLKSLVLSEGKGIPIRFRVFLPPNLERTAPSDRIMVKVDVEEATGERHAPEKIDRGRAYHLSLPHLAAGALIEQWCGGKLHGFLQLDRKKMSQLLRALKNEEVFFWVNKPYEAIVWQEGVLPGVHKHLEMREKKPEVARERPQAKPKVAAAAPKASSRSVSQAAPAAASRSAAVVDGSPNYLSIELPPRSAVDYHELLQLVKDKGFNLEARNRRWWLRDRHKTLCFLAEYYGDLRDKHRARFSENFEKQFAGLQWLKPEVEVHEMHGIFEVEMHLGGDVDEGELNRRLASGRPYVENGDAITLVPPGAVEKMTRLQQRLSNDKMRPFSARSRVKLKPWQLADADNLFEESLERWQPPEAWAESSRALHNLSALKEAPVNETLQETLRLYQKIGVAWLYHLFNHKMGGVLADEMGLGKTLQAIGLITSVLDAKKQALVVCPAGLVGNWLRELSRWAPELKVIAHHGQKRGASSEHLEDYAVVVTSYTTLTRDIGWLADHTFELVIADEAQHIKNRKTQNARSLRSVKAEGRFLLTGTPIENSLKDLQSLFEFLMPGYLAKAPGGIGPDERGWYQQRMRQQAAPFILRRTKKQVAPELPEKIEQVIYCDMEPKQRKLYQEVQEKGERELLSLEVGGAGEGRLKLAAFTQLLRLRQVCADPRLLREQFKASQSAKLQTFLEILDEAVDDGHRILVFSQFVSMLSLLREEMDKQKLPYAYIDGSTKDRLAEADRFNENEDIPVFLISLKAGGTGLNLTGADTVVHFDPWWNPAVEAQATDRAHRIGQTRVVTNIKLIVAGSVEEKVLEMQKTKADLLKDLLEASEAEAEKLSLEDLKDLMG